MFLLQNYEALGTVWYIEVFEDIDDNRKASAIHKITHTIETFQNNYSRFKTDSILTSLNHHRTVAYDDDLAQMLKKGEQLREDTEGVFSLFILEDITKKGYGEHLAQFSVTDTGKVGISISETAISLLGDKSVDLGGIGKGYLIDKLALVLKENGITQFLINGGGDIYATHDNGKPITIYMQHPKEHDIYIGTVEIMNQSFCASSSYMRTWKKDDKDVNHFITKNGDDIWAASYVVGDMASTADTLATVMVLVSTDKALAEKYAELYDMKYLVVQDNGETFGNLRYSLP